MESNEVKITLDQLLEMILHEAIHKDFYLRKDNSKRLWNIPLEQRVSKDDINKAINRLDDIYKNLKPLKID